MKKITFLTLFAVTSFGLTFGSFDAKAGDSEVLAEVNGTPITQKDLEDRLNTLPPQIRARFETNKEQFLQELIKQRLLVDEAKVQKIEKDEKLLSVLKKLKTELMVQRLVEKEVLEKVKVSEDEIRTYFDTNKDQFQSPDQVHAYHILLPDEKKAKKIQKRLKKGEDFETLAKEVSVGPSSARGGDLGFVQKGQLVPEFEKVAFKIKLNKISEVVKTQFGYHIIKVTEKKPASQKTFKDVSQNIQLQLQQQKQRQFLEEYLLKLKSKGDIKVFANGVN